MKNKGYTTINIFGLAVGICCFLLISLFVRNEFSYDRFHTKADRIYRVWQYENYGPKEDFVNTMTPVSMVRVLSENYPEIESGSRVYQMNGLVKRGEDEFNEAIRAVDPAFFEIFDFTQLRGNTETPMPGSNAIVLSESAAEKYFGMESPIGQTMDLTINEEVHHYVVSAVMADPPEASSIQFDFLISLENESLFFTDRARRNWFNVVVESYLLLRPEQDPMALEAKFPGIVQQYLGDNYEENTFFLHLQPLTDIHLDTSLPAGIEPISDPKYSYIMGTIGLLVLLLACINYLTLAVGRSFSRTTEVGVRKALGAYHKQIVFQFWGEALLVTFFALLAGILLAYLSLGTFNELTGKILTLQFNGNLLLTSTALLVFIALIAGIYPSLILSKSNPVTVLRSKQVKGTSLGLFGKGLVVFQFTASIVLIISTLVVGRQIDFLINKDLGYKKDALVVIPTHRSGEAADTFAKVYLEALDREPDVAEACSSIYSMAENFWYEIGFTDSRNTYREFALNGVDPRFLKTYNIGLSEGRDFEAGNMSDKQSGVLVNETFVREFGIEDPIGTQIDPFGVTILGVVKDFHFQTLNNKIRPLMLAWNTAPILRASENLESRYMDEPRITVRLASADIASGMAGLESVWNKISPSREFEYTFLDASLAAQYKSEARSKTIVKIASLLSVFIACMGLFGLATLHVARKTAEIGIRKVMGAEVWNIVRMITADFIILSLVAILIAFPLAWWAMRLWLQDFAYSISMSWWVFALAGLFTVAITIFSVSFQAIKAALADPVKSLRSE